MEEGNNYELLDEVLKEAEKQSYVPKNDVLPAIEILALEQIINKIKDGERKSNS